jgi:hypothetical protein
MAPEAAEAQVLAATRYEETTRSGSHVKVTKVGEGGLPLEEVLMDSDGKVLATNILHPEILVPSMQQPAGNGQLGVLGEDERADQDLQQDPDLKQDELAGEGVKAGADGDGSIPGFIVASPTEVEGLPGQDEEAAAASAGGAGQRSDPGGAVGEAKGMDVSKGGASSGGRGEEEQAAAPGEVAEEEPSGIVTPLAAAIGSVADQVRLQQGGRSAHLVGA